MSPEDLAQPNEGHISCKASKFIVLSLLDTAPRDFLEAHQLTRHLDENTQAEVIADIHERFIPDIAGRLDSLEVTPEELVAELISGAIKLASEQLPSEEQSAVVAFDIMPRLINSLITNPPLRARALDNLQKTIDEARKGTPRTTKKELDKLVGIRRYGSKIPYVSQAHLSKIAKALERRPHSY